MNKKNIWLLMCISLVLLMGGSTLTLFNGSPKYGLLKINGVGITQEKVTMHSKYAELPLTEVMMGLGMNVDWVSNSNAEITYEDKKYTLNLLEVSLIETGKQSNLLLPPPGGKRFYTVLEKELIVDSNTIKSTMHQMGIKINIEINRKEQIVYIFEIIH